MHTAMYKGTKSIDLEGKHGKEKKPYHPGILLASIPTDGIQEPQTPEKKTKVPSDNVFLWKVSQTEISETTNCILGTKGPIIYRVLAMSFISKSEQEISQIHLTVLS